MRTVLVCEYVTGGGLAGEPLPTTWAAEGAAMRRAIAGDFAALPDVDVVVTLDARLPDESAPWRVERIGPGEFASGFARLVAASDLTAPIAPESGGILLGLARAIIEAGGRSLGSTPAGIAIAGDKLATAEHLVRAGVATPLTRRVVPADGLPGDFPYPAVLKPIDGAGSMDTFWVRSPVAMPEAALALPEAILQPFAPGIPLGVTFLVGSRGEPTCIGVGRQRVDFSTSHFRYLGGTIPEPDPGRHATALEMARRALAAIPGLLGLVGVDLNFGSRPIVLEVNPRPTTSVVGLLRHLSPGTLARAWLDAVDGRVGAAAGLAKIIHAGRPFAFNADGTSYDALTDGEIQSTDPDASPSTSAAPT